MTQKFPNAPLVKTVFEIKFLPVLRIDAEKHLFTEDVHDEYPYWSLPANTQGVHPLLLPIQLTSEGNKKILMFTTRQFSFTTSEYSIFPDFKRQSLDVMRRFINRFGIKQVLRMGLLYVNNIPLELDETGRINIQNYLQFGFQLPPAFGDDLSGFTALFTHRYGSDSLRTEVQPRPNESDHTNTITLSFDYFTETGRSATELENFLDRGHDKIEKVFLNMVTDRYQEYMRGM